MERPPPRLAQARGRPPPGGRGNGRGGRRRDHARLGACSYLGPPEAGLRRAPLGPAASARRWTFRPPRYAATSTCLTRWSCSAGTPRPPQGRRDGLQLAARVGHDPYARLLPDRQPGRAAAAAGAVGRGGPADRRCPQRAAGRACSAPPCGSCAPNSPPCAVDYDDARRRAARGAPGHGRHHRHPVHPAACGMSTAHDRAGPRRPAGRPRRPWPAGPAGEPARRGPPGTSGRCSGWGCGSRPTRPSAAATGMRTSQPPAPQRCAELAASRRNCRCPRRRSAATRPWSPPNSARAGGDRQPRRPGPRPPPPGSSRGRALPAGLRAAAAGRGARPPRVSRGPAAAAVRRAHAVAERIGAAPIAADAAALPAGPGSASDPATVRARGRGRRSALTEPATSSPGSGSPSREREVLLLLAAGPLQPRDRPRSVHQREDRERARVQHPGQARRQRPGRGRRRRSPPRRGRPVTGLTFRPIPRGALRA